MACMEHLCRKCGWNDMNNDMYRVCPVCKSEEAASWFDEPKEDDVNAFQEEDDE